MNTVINCQENKEFISPWSKRIGKDDEKLFSIDPDGIFIFKYITPKMYRGKNAIDPDRRSNFFLNPQSKNKSNKSNIMCFILKCLIGVLSSFLYKKYSLI
jgi:hypothetical protein